MNEQESQFLYKVTLFEAACISHNMAKHLLWGINWQGEQ